MSFFKSVCIFFLLLIELEQGIDGGFFVAHILGVNLLNSKYYKHSGVYIIKIKNKYFMQNTWGDACWGNKEGVGGQNEKKEEIMVRNKKIIHQKEEKRLKNV